MRHTTTMSPHAIQKISGLTLIELTLVVAVILGLVTIIFIGATSYKEGSNRAMCILNISQIQKAVRAYQNMYQRNFGDPCVEATLVGSGRFIDTPPACPSGGSYTWRGTIPPLDTAYLTCSFAAERDHAPTNPAGW